ncbi:MAG: hypothetical protein HQL50_01030 [Magnetococcales bacterium]|nr:hypothetical protein [Magnetococcales bacterium]
MSSQLPSHSTNNDVEYALAVLRPEESRALIGMAVARLPQVRDHLSAGRMIIVGGSTTRHVVRNLLQEDPGYEAFAVGCIQDGLLNETPKETRGEGPYIFEEGTHSRGWPGPALDRFEYGDLYIKGGNAIDPEGNVAILMGSPVGGTIGAAWTILSARGGELIIPISIGKLVPSAIDCCRLLGQGKHTRIMGTPVGAMPIPAGMATVVTEITAFQSLFGVHATVVAAGGMHDCAGSLTLHLESSSNRIENAWNALISIREEVSSLQESG